MVKKQILQTIEKENLLENGVHIVLGLSGGPDSVCLFDVLCKEAESRNWRIYPVHINHRFRPGAAEEDQAYVEDLSARRGWPCTSFVYDCNRIAMEEKMTSEEAGRKVRYDAFRQKAEEICGSGVRKRDIRIVVAQNADDQAETILFRILRGAGTDGLAGMGYIRYDEAGYPVVRPLLDCMKAEILEYCRLEGLHPRIDQSNLEPLYMRNKIRLELIPNLEAYNPNLKDTLIRMGKNCAMDRDCLQKMAADAFDKLCKTAGDTQIVFDGPGLRNLHKSIRQRVIASALRGIGMKEDLTYAHFAKCEEIVFHDHPSARTELPRGYCLAKNYQDIKIFRRENLKEARRLRIRTMTLEEYEELHLEKNSHGAFDADQMEAAYGVGFTERIFLGRREAGDTIAIGEGKRKKVQDYFVDRKIPKDERDDISLVKIGHDVLWILPYEGKGRYCSNFKLCSDTKNVICIEIICGL